MKKINILLLLLFLGIITLAGLGETSQGGPAIPPTIPMIQKGNPVPAVSPSGPTVPLEPRAQIAPLYNPTGKPDPFAPAAVTIVNPAKEKKKVLPLEQFEVGDFELVGVVSGPGIKKALVQDLTGKGFFIQVGTRIGKTGGQVILITDKEVHIKEPFQNFLGGRSSRVIILKLPQTRLGMP